jgi:hypothetical protein
MPRDELRKESRKMKIHKNNVDVQGLERKLRVNKREFNKKKFDSEETKTLYKNEIERKDIIFLKVRSTIKRKQNKKA